MYFLKSEFGLRRCLDWSLPSPFNIPEMNRSRVTTTFKKHGFAIEMNFGTSLRNALLHYIYMYLLFTNPIFVLGNSL